MFSAKPNFNTQTYTLLLGIENNLPGLYAGNLTSEAAGNGFRKKDELHITVIGFKNGKIIQEALDKLQDRQTVMEQLRDMAEELDWSFELRPEIYHISKESRESIIRLVDLESMSNFYERLNNLLGTNLETPPAHITLYTGGTDEKSYMGIGVNSVRELERLNPRPVGVAPTKSTKRYNKIVLPTRPQPDTIVAIFILKKFGVDMFPGIREAAVEFWQVLPENTDEETFDKSGTILIDLGGGRFDHHDKRTKTTASELISQYLGVAENPSLAKLLEYARRDDFYGKGTISDDPIDRAFGLSALIAVLNKSLVQNPAKVIDLVMPMIIAHHNEELKRTEEMPKELEEKMAAGQAETFQVKQRDKKLSVITIESDNPSMAGFLRSHNGGKYDVVVQCSSKKYVNILTRPAKRIDLRSLVALIRLQEATLAGTDIELAVHELAKFGRIKEIPEWYYDPATNSMQNGGINPKEISPTRIGREDLKKIIDLGLSERAWSPMTAIV